VIIVQAGHVNINRHPRADLRGGTGAPGEQVFTRTLAGKLTEELEERDIESIWVDALPGHEVFNTDADLFMVLHYDSYSRADLRGCRSARPQFDVAAARSDDAVNIFNEMYPTLTGIPLHPHPPTVNMTQYYAWDYPTPNTPCIIVECGIGMHPVDGRILKLQDGTASPLIAHALADVIGEFQGGIIVDPVLADRDRLNIVKDNMQGEMEFLIQQSKLAKDWMDLPAEKRLRRNEYAYHQLLTDGEFNPQDFVQIVEDEFNV